MNDTDKRILEIVQGLPALSTSTTPHQDPEPVTGVEETTVEPTTSSPDPYGIEPSTEVPSDSSSQESTPRPTPRGGSHSEAKAEEPEAVGEEQKASSEEVAEGTQEEGAQDSAPQPEGPVKVDEVDGSDLVFTVSTRWVSHWQFSADRPMAM